MLSDKIVVRHVDIVQICKHGFCMHCIGSFVFVTDKFCMSFVLNASIKLESNLV